uniref:Olfactory receptor n=1 Tax=Apolygus lucorum TaxID=248454 RepID=A0A1Q1NIJ5_APOLU|nr:olfactory receptor [Apolygus lucorum]
MSMSVWALTIGGLRSSLGIEMTYACLTIMTTVQHFHMYRNRTRTEAIIATFQEIRNTYQKGTDIEFKNYTRFMWKVVKVYIVMIVGICSAMSLPFFADLVVWFVWETPTAFRIPIGMDSMVDKEPVRDATYFAVVLFSNCWTILGGVTQMGVDTFLFVSCYSLSSMVKTFCKQLKVPPNSTPEETTVHIRLLAAHQQALYKLQTEIRRTFGFPFFVQNLLGSFCICSLLYVMSENGATLLSQFIYVFNMIAVLMILASTAHVAQHVKNTTSEVFEALYEMNWYTLRPSDRKYLVTMLGVARNPLCIHFYGLLPLDMENFMSMLNTSYTYFMFLKSIG